MAKKPPPKAPNSGSSKPAGMISQTGNRPGGTVTGSYKKSGETRNGQADKGKK